MMSSNSYIIIILCIAGLGFLFFYILRLKPNKKTDVKELYSEGLDMMINGLQRSAYNNFKKIVEIDSENIKAYLRLGQVLRESGNPQKAIKIHKGSVTALAGFGDNYSNFQTDATINQGNSGGPIMNQKGNIVGVAVQLIAAEHAQNVFFGVKSSTLKTFAKANNIKFLTPNYREKSNEDLGKLITDATVFLECWMTVAKIKQMIAQAENTKAFYSEHR